MNVLAPVLASLNPFSWIRLPYQLRWEVVTNNRDLFVDGLFLALRISVIALLFGCVIGMLGAFARNSQLRPLRWFVFAYVEIIRNAPLLLLVFIFYYGLPLSVDRKSWQHDVILDVMPTPERTFTVVLAIYSGAYLIEIFSAGILSVGKRYLDAGHSLGLSRWQLARHVTMPIMLRTVLPSLGSTFISLFKDTGIAFFIGVQELSFAANKINTDYFRPIEGWAAAGALYLVTSWLLAFVLRFAERQIKWTV